MEYLLFLAHGAWGIWDELIPMLLIGGFAVILVASAYLSRRNEETIAEQAQPITDPATPPTDNRIQLD